MAEPLHSVPAQNQSLKQNQMMIVGRLDRCSKFESKFDHIITCAAVDEFSKPTVLRLSAATKLGNIGEIVKCHAMYNGWANNYDNKNDETVYDARGFFVAVE